MLGLAAAGRAEDLVRAEPPARQAQTRAMMARLQEIYGEELARISRLRADLIAATRRQGRAPEAAAPAAMAVLYRAFTRATEPPPPAPGARDSFAAIRARVAQKLRLSGMLTEAHRRPVCGALVDLVFEPSGLSRRLASTAPAHGSAEAEGAFDRLRQRFAEEIALLDQECRHVVHDTRELSDGASDRRITRRLTRAFVGGGCRTAPGPRHTPAGTGAPPEGRRARTRSPLI